jgi:hypothetical protein
LRSPNRSFGYHGGGEPLALAAVRETLNARKHPTLEVTLN